MSRKKHNPSLSGVVQVIVGLAIAIAMVTAGVGHNGVANPRPPTVCAQLQVLSGSS